MTPYRGLTPLPCEHHTDGSVTLSGEAWTAVEQFLRGLAQTRGWFEDGREDGPEGEDEHETLHDAAEDAEVLCDRLGIPYVPFEPDDDEAAANRNEQEEWEEEHR